MRGGRSRAPILLIMVGGALVASALSILFMRLYVGPMPEMPPRRQVPTTSAAPAAAEPVVVTPPAPPALPPPPKQIAEPVPKVGEVVEHHVPVEGGTFSSAGITVTVPSGALAQPAVLKIASLDRPHPALDANLAIVSGGFDIECDAASFAQDVTVTLPYEPSKLPQGRTEADLIGLVHTGDGYRRVPPSSLDRENHRLTFAVRHFSQPAVGVLLNPGTVRSHPTLPFDLVIITPPKSPKLAESVYASIEKAYQRLTTFAPGLSTPFPAPPHGDGRLRVEITDLTEYRARYAGGFIPSGVTPSHDLLQIDYREEPNDPPWDVPIHEFFHAVQWTLFERYRLLGKPARWSSFAAESTAAFASTKLTRPGGEGATPLDDAYPFTSLTYDPFAARAADVSHAYQSSSFFDFLTQRYGLQAVSEFLSQVYGGTPDDRAALDAAIAQVSGGKDSLAKAFPEFVIDVAFRGRFGDTRIEGKKPDALNLPAFIKPTSVPLEVTGEQPQARAEIPLEGKALSLPGVVELVPSWPGDEPQRLSLTTGGRGSLWAVAVTKGGAQKLLGGGETLRATLDKDIAKVVVLPVALEDGGMKVSAALGGSNGMTWKLTQVELVPPNGEGQASDSSITMAKAVDGSLVLTNRSLPDSKVSWNRTATYRWKALPTELVEGEPIAVEIEGEAGGANPDGFHWAPIFNVTSDGEASFDVPDKPHTGFFLPLRVGFGFSDRKAADNAKATIVPIRSRNALSDNGSQVLSFLTDYGWGVKYHWTKE